METQSGGWRDMTWGGVGVDWAGEAETSTHRPPKTKTVRERERQREVTCLLIQYLAQHISSASDEKWIHSERFWRNSERVLIKNPAWRLVRLGIKKYNLPSLLLYSYCKYNKPACIKTSRLLVFSVGNQSNAQRYCCKPPDRKYHHMAWGFSVCVCVCLSLCVWRPADVTPGWPPPMKASRWSARVWFRMMEGDCG